MIEQYSTGSHMMVQGTKYYQDLKIKTFHFLAGKFQM